MPVYYVLCGVCVCVVCPLQCISHVNYTFIMYFLIVGTWNWFIRYGIKLILKYDGYTLHFPPTGYLV